MAVGWPWRGQADGWVASFAGGPDGIGAFELQLEPFDHWADDGADGYHGQRARVAGELRGSAGSITLAGHRTADLRARRHAAGRRATRELAVWVHERLTIDLNTVRERPHEGHDRERVRAAIVEHDPRSVQPIEQARLSTTYGADGRPLRAGLELWATEDSAYPRRAAGETICAASLTTAAGRWDCAFMSWRIEGDDGPRPVRAGARLSCRLRRGPRRRAPCTPAAARARAPARGRAAPS